MWLELLRLPVFGVYLASLMLYGSWPLTTVAEFHEGKPFCSTQVVLVRSLSSIPRVLGLWVCSRASTRMISCLTALRGLASLSVPVFVVLLAPLQCGFSGSRWNDILVPRVVMGASLLISLCCVLCRGNSCRVSGAGMIVPMFRWFATLFPALLGSPEGPFY